MRMLIAISLTVTWTAFGQDLAALHTGQRLRVAMLGQGPMCDAALAGATNTDVLLHMLSSSLECGTRGEIVGIPKDQIYQLSVVSRSSRRRAVVGVLAGLGAIAGIGAIAAHVGDLETVLVALPAAPLAAAGAWTMIPDKRESVLFIHCPDRFHCFSPASITPKGNPATPDEK